MAESSNEQKTNDLHPRRIVNFGFGSVAKSVFPIFIEKIPLTEIVLVDGRPIEPKEYESYKPVKVTIIQKSFPYGELFKGVLEIIKDDDIVLDLFGMNETLDIIKACNERKGIVYINASMEECEGHEYPSQSALYQAMYDYRDKVKPKFTGCIDAGANPGMITHFCILGLKGMAESAIKRGVQDAKILEQLIKEGDHAKLAQQLQVDVIHISEIEQMSPNNPDDYKDFTTSSWCVPGFQEEWNFASEVSKGTHDAEALSKEGFSPIPGSVPTTVICPYPIYQKTACPFGIFTGKSVRHPETLEIAYVFSNKEHVPTVGFVYQPSKITRDCHDRKDWASLKTKPFTEENAGPLKGRETMGATLISSRKDIPIRYYGSVVTCEQSREVKCITNPTTLQVAAGLIGHLMLALKNPERGLCMPHDFDSEEIMKYAAPYLGTIYDQDLDVTLPTKWEELLSTKEALDAGFEQSHN